MRLIPTAWLAAACLALLCAAGCEPPGKPKADEADESKSTNFKTVYALNCAGCHGDNGKLGPGRILNDAVYLSWIPKEDLRRVIEYGRPGTNMPPWAAKEGGPLQPDQVTALVEGMNREWAKPVKGAPPPAYADSTTVGDLNNGKKLFLKDCFACHGPGARIGVVTDPSYLALTTNQNLRTSIVVGRPDLGMPDYRFINAGHALNDQDVADLVAYLASKRPAGSQAAQLEASQGAK